MASARKLVIVSDTPMWLDSSGTPCVYEPTLREIEQVAVLFDEVVWLGFHRQGYRFGNGRPTVNPSIRFRLLLPSGGHTFLSTIKSILLLPYYKIVILRYMLGAKNIHTRGPSVPALLAVVLSFFFRKKKYWHKYAGNWGATHSPFFYRLQKKLVLKATFSTVTINGQWSDQLPHILSFDNPCFTSEELQQASEAGKQKKFEPPFTFCFAGRLEEAKGVGNLLQAFSNLHHDDKVGALVLAGDGTARPQYEVLAAKAKVRINFAGGLNRSELNDVYAKSHFMILPSQSEGFPKVLAEAAAFGCIPVVTNVSALAQYIRHSVNGFFLDDNHSDTIQRMLDFLLARDHNFAKISDEARVLASGFTYEHFVVRLRKEVFITEHR